MMEREIKFRGLTPDGKWVYGWMFINCIGETKIIEHVDIAPTYSDPGGSSQSIYHDVIYETVGQYAEFNDSQDTNIFERDKIAFTVFDFNDNDTQHEGIVTFANGEWQLWKSEKEEYYDSDGAFNLAWVHAQDSEIKIIGNVYQTPELL